MAFVKDPSEVKDYGRDWTDHLDDSDTIAESTWVVETGLTAGDEELIGAVAKIWLSGGTAGEDYAVTNHVTTTGGREFERTFTVAVRDL
jgi:hypothetical protein